MEAGTSLGPYRIDRELGVGGMGKVFAATAGERCPGIDDGTPVALKVVHHHLLETPGFFQRFLREAEIGQAVQHPNVVRTLGCDATGDAYFLVMEYVEGQTLRALLDELERVPEELCRHIAREVCKGLAAIHTSGVIHRDMKPENVLITRDHVVKVMDLGVARLADEAIRLSQTGTFVGSIHYAAPECFRDGGKNVDGRADLHALGLVLYELACGVNPYLGADVQQSLHRILREEPRRLGDVNPQLSPFFEEVVHCLLAKDRDERFTSAAELLDVLESGEESPWWHARARALQVETRRPPRRVRVPRETAVYGRDDDLATIRTAYAEASAGSGRVLLIEGEAGIGKTRLVDEFVARLQQEGEDVDFLFGSYPPGGAATAAGAWSTAFREQFGADGSADYLPDNQLLVPAFDALLRGEPSPSGAQELTRQSLQTCFVRATQSLAAERTTIVLIDDLHFAPDAGRALFTALAAAVPGLRVVLVGSYRPGISEDWVAGLSRLDQTVRLDLARLGPKDLVRLLGDSLGSARLAEELGGKIALKSDGNPFFAFEIIRGLREGNLLTQRDDGSWSTTRIIDEIQIPSSVLDLVNGRVADLTEEERDLLDVASCRGFDFDPTLVGDVCGIGAIPVLKRFGQIERRHRLVRSAGRDYAFDHHQVQEALYGALNERLREHYHAAIAASLESRVAGDGRTPEELGGPLCVDLCEQFLKGGRGPEALRYFEVALTHLEEGFLNGQAVALAERVLAVEGLLDPVGRGWTLLRLARLLTYVGSREPARVACEEAEGLARAQDDRKLAAQATLAFGRNLLLTSHHDEAGIALRRALEDALAVGDRTTEAAAHVSLGTLGFFQDRYEEAQEHFERAGAVRREIGDREGEADQACAMGEILFARGRMDEARTQLARSVHLSREIGHRRGEARATGNLGVVLRSLGRLDEARRLCERHLELSRATGHRGGEAIAMGSLGALARDLGHLEESRSHLERYLELSREIGNRRGTSIALLNLGITVGRQGGAAGCDRLRESRELALELGVRQVAVAAGIALAEQLAPRGEVDAAREALESASQVAEEAGFGPFLVVALCNLALLPGGGPADALAAFAEHREGLEPEVLRYVRFLLWKATDDEEHLVEAKRLLDEAVALVAEECREPMLTNVDLHRDIMTAWDARGSSS